MGYRMGKRKAIRCYTDYSRTTADGLFGHPTIFQAEFYAIDEYARYSFDKIYLGHEISILSDR